MARYLSLYLPFWGTDRLRRAVGLDALPPERPLVLQGKVGSRRLVTAVDALAHQRGVRPGMAVAKAQVLIEGLEVRDAELERDAEALEKLAVWALRLYSPVVAADPPDGLILDITGAAHLYGGEAALVSDMLRRLDALHITAYATVADSWGAAHALVRFAGKSSLIIAPGKSTEAILPLPVAALRLPAETVEELRLIGIDTIGELAAKPRAPLALRYGPDLWRRVDMAFGRLAEPIEPVHISELISVERAFFDMEGALYRVYASPDRVTDLMLEPGETVQAISAGDTARWIIGDTKSGEGPSQRTHVLIKPHISGLKTNLVVLTSVRTYHLQLESTPSTYMAAVAWRYPTPPIVREEKSPKPTVDMDSQGLDIAKLNFQYVIEGASPPWRPRQVFDDGTRTYIVFPPQLATSAAPPLFLVSATGEAQLVNYRVVAGHYVVDRLIEVAELRLGKAPQTVVRLRRADVPVDSSKRRRHD